MSTKGRFPLKFAASSGFLQTGSVAAFPCSLMLSAMLLLVLPATLQGSDLGKLLAGKPFPLAVKLKDLNGGWRRFTIRTGGSVSGNVSVNVSGSTAGSTSQNNLTGSLSGGPAYVTQGRTVSASGQVYLVAYHLPSAGLDLSLLLQALATKTPPAAAVLTSENPFPLAAGCAHGRQPRRRAPLRCRAGDW